MKKNTITLALLTIGFSAMAQVSDSVSVGAGYANESYYSLENGEVANVDNSNWDLAFDASPFGAAIRVNRLNAVYIYPGSIADFTELDTTGISGWNRTYNSDLSWSAGALNNAADIEDELDLGWGAYNTTTHYTEGNRLFVIELASGDFKKLFVEELGAGLYHFQYDFLDNTALQTKTIEKSEYSGMNFVHYSMETNEIIVREPLSETWDIVFSNFHTELAPDVFYGVTGALTNVDVEVLEVNDLPSEEATFDGAFESNINAIGYDWKAFNMETYAYDIADSLTYFVHSNTGDLWKLIFTGFNGSSDGKIYFTKEKVSAVSVEEERTSAIQIYPNPVVNILTIQLSDDISSVKLYSSNGQLVYSENANGSTQIQIDASAFISGLYILQASTESGTLLVEKIMIAE